MASLEDLLKWYCPIVDSALVTALFNDVDPNDKRQVAELLRTLDGIAADAEPEEQSGFDASGSGFNRDVVIQHSTQSHQSSTSRDGDSCSTGPARTSTAASAYSSTREQRVRAANPPLLARQASSRSESNDISFSRPGSSHTSSSNSGYQTPAEYDTEIDNLPEETKLEYLVETFSELNTDEIGLSLRKNGGDFVSTVNELLVIKLLRDEGPEQVDEGHSLHTENSFKYSAVHPHVLGVSGNDEKATPKGIDGFFNSSGLDAKKKGKGKKKKKSEPHTKLRSAPGQRADQSNRWAEGSENVSFIAERVYLEPEIIKSVYSQAHNIHTTILYLAGVAYKAANPEEDVSYVDSELQISALQLLQDFEELQIKDAIGLIFLAELSLDKARELAAEVAKCPPPAVTPKISLSPHRTPNRSRTDLSGHEENYSFSAVAARGRRPNSFSGARAELLAHATSIHHRTRGSPPVLRQIAGPIYADSSYEIPIQTPSKRPVVVRGQVPGAAEADAYIRDHGQSGDRWLDLHGIDVANGIRIAKEKVQQWWNVSGKRDDEERKEWARTGKFKGKGIGRGNLGSAADDLDGNFGFKIVTGIGLHSEGGKAKMLPQVRKAFEQAGWKVQLCPGGMIITGKSR